MVNVLRENNTKHIVPNCFKVCKAKLMEMKGERQFENYSSRFQYSSLSKEKSKVTEKKAIASNSTANTSNMIIMMDSCRIHITFY
jgi:hypothetical protein